MSTNSVLIVGAGPTGLVLAIELLRRQVPFRLVDHRPANLPQDRAAFVKSRTLEIFATYGLADDFLNAGHVINGFSFFAGGAEAASYRLDSIDSPFPFFLGISESETEKLLTKKLEQSGATIEHGVRFIGYTEEPDGLVAHLATDSGEQNPTFGWIVGADGLHSSVREAAGIEFPGHDYPLRWGVVDGHLANWSHPEDMTAVQFAPPVFAAPIGNGRRRIYFRADAGARVADVKKKVATLGRGVELVDHDEPQLFHSHCKVAETYRKGNIFLAGDAAHAISPSQAHGMNTGIQDSFNLGWKLALVINGTAPNALLDTYEAERRPIAELVGKTGDDAEELASKGDPEATRTISEVISTEDGRHGVATDEAETAYRYAPSNIVTESVDPSQISATTEIGCRVGDVQGLKLGENPKALSLHEIIAHPHHTLFFLAGDASEEVISSGSALVRQATDRFGKHLRGYVVHTNALVTTAEGSELLHDLDGAAHRRLGYGSPCLALVRPDGHLGLRCVPPTFDALLSHLSNTLA